MTKVADNTVYEGKLVSEGLVSATKAFEALDKGNVAIYLGDGEKAARHLDLFNGLVSIPLEMVHVPMQVRETFSAELIAEVGALKEKVGQLEKTLLSFTLSVNATHTSKKVECFECRSCGLQPDLFSLVARSRRHAITRTFPTGPVAGGGFVASH